MRRPLYWVRDGLVFYINYHAYLIVLSCQYITLLLFKNGASHARAGMAYCAPGAAPERSASSRGCLRNRATVTVDPDQPLLFDPQQLLKLASYRMPFGKYANRLLIDLPEPYVIWFANEGFPRGELGNMLRIVHEIKINGLEYLFDPLRKQK